MKFSSGDENERAGDENESLETKTSVLEIVWRQKRVTGDENEPKRLGIKKVDD